MNTESQTPNMQDLEQLAEFAGVIAAARDALSDDIVTRMSSAFSEGMVLLDRLTRNHGLMRLLQVLDRPENQFMLLSLSNAISATSRDLATSAPATGGIGGILKVMSDPGVQEGLKMMALLGSHLSEGMRELHHRGGA